MATTSTEEEDAVTEQMVTMVSERSTSALDVIHKVSMYFEGYCLIFVLLIGIAGNLLSIIVFLRVKRGESATAHYLGLMAFSDLGYLLVFGIPEWFHRGLKYVTNGAWYVDLVSLTPAMCRFNRFTMHFFQFLSAWLLVAFSMERCLAVMFPLKRAMWFTTRRRLTIIAVIVVLSVIANVQVAVFYDVFDHYGNVDCFYRNSLSQVEKIILTTVHLSTMNIIPIILVSVINFIIIGSLLGTKSFAHSEAQEVKMRRKEIRCVVSLVLISLCYVVSMGPMTVSWTYYNSLVLHDIETGLTRDRYEMKMIYEIAFLCSALSIINFTVNFLVYSFSLPYYKNTVKRMLMRRRNEASSSSSAASNQTVSQSVATITTTKI